MAVLTERERMVLELIVDSYIISAEAVGSRTIAKSMRNKLSSATIRNIMADLEEQGFLYKPHVVAGRIPTYKAFRYYVNSMLVLRSLRRREMQVLESLFKPRYAHVEGLMEDASKALASISKFTSIVVEPRVNTMLFKEIEFVKLSKHTVLTVFVTSAGIVHNRLVEAEENFSPVFLNSMKNYMNEKFSGVPFYTLKEEILEDVEKDKESYARLLGKIKETIENIMEEEDQREIYIEGASKMMDMPEFSDLARLKELFHTLERKEKLLRLLDSCLKEEGIHVIMGTESEIKEMRDLSIITSTYRIGEKSYGVLGVIGPIRMNYGKIIPIVNYTAKTLTDILSIM
ncbi:MAG: heat-inducible transcriptional repressor HrcA [Syntrophobacterales bacterium]|jgi:heat-inducible transcriptional repressor|nr:heat-inducible transcriptional repressor HrcA [Syntrophobacterales bacterium]